MTTPARTLNRVLIVVFLAGFYLQADLVLTASLKIPAVGALFGGLGLLALHLGRLRHGDLVFVAVWIGLALTSLIANPAFWEATGLWSRNDHAYATSFVVFLTALAMGIGVFTGLRLWRAEEIARLALATLLLMLAGAAAERWLGLAPISDQVRTLLYVQDITYAENLRDQVLYGGVRPKLFTSEPSHVAKFYMVMLLVWYVTASAWWRTPAVYSLLLAGVTVVQSPTMLVALPAIWAADLCRSRAGAGWLLAVALALALAPLGLTAAEALFAGRLEHILTGQDTSFIYRAVMPFDVMARVWADHPLFGLGIGAKESGIPYAVAAAHDLGLDAGILLATTSPLGNNGLAIGLIQLGAVGSLGFAASLVAFWRFACGRHWPFAAAGMLGYLLLIGGINEPRFWGGLALLGAAAAAAERRASEV